jgi:hypothetical protein
VASGAEIPYKPAMRTRDMPEEAPLPTQQHSFEGLARLSERELHWRREVVFLVFAGLFLGTLAMLNILGISRFLDVKIQLFGFEIPMPLAVGVLPYPLTFLCTDFISELYGHRRANAVVWMGLVLNIWVVAILWLGGRLPGFEAPEQRDTHVYFQIQKLAFGAVFASMAAYLTAQFVDVQLFHWWKRLTKGRHLWLRNNGSTLVSQAVDTTMVIFVTHFQARALPIDAHQPLWPQLFKFIMAGYTFKLAVALLDTIPFYIGVHYLSRYLRLRTIPEPKVCRAPLPTPAPETQ